LYRFLVISSLLLFVSVNSYAVDSPTKSLPPLPNDTSTEEYTPFIEKGDRALPVSPEISKTKIDLPPLPKPVDEPAISETKKSETLPAGTPPKAIEAKKQDNPGTPPALPTSPAVSTEAKAPAPIISAPPVAPEKPPAVVNPAPTEQATAPVTAPVVPPQPATTPAPVAKTITPQQGRVIQPQAPQQQAPPHVHNIPPKEPAKEVKIVKKTDPLQERFIRDEVLLLSFAEDDIILGMLSSKGRLDQMEGAAYIRLYEKSIEEAKTREKGRNNTWFILSRSKEEPVSLPKKYLFKISVDDIEKSNLTDLRILANNYSILDMIDKQGNSLLHIASFNDNPAITKWLIMRGIDINMLNHKGASALDIAENRQYWRIYNLLEQAGAQQ
jgi:hypothetical protein